MPEPQEPQAQQAQPESNVQPAVQAAPAPTFQPLMDDPEIQDMVGEQVDKIRVENAYHAAVALQPTLAPPVRYIPWTRTSLGASMQGQNLDGLNPADRGSQTLTTMAAVYEGETDADALSRAASREQDHEQYLASRSMSQATFGVTSHLWTSDIERDFEQRYSPQEVIAGERVSFAANLAAWPITPAGWITNKVFGAASAFVSKVMQRSSLAAKMIEFRPQVPVRKWLTSAFGRTSTEAAGPLATTLARMETAVANAGGHFLADGKLYIPKEVRAASGKAWQEIQEAVGQLKTVLGQETKVKVVTDPTRLTALGYAGTAAGGAASGAAAGGFYRGAETGATWALGKTPEERQKAAGDFLTNIGHGAVGGAVAGAPLSVAQAALSNYLSKTLIEGTTTPPNSRQLTTGAIVKR